jgi:hypothetical protein
MDKEKADNNFHAFIGLITLLAVTFTVLALVL